MLWNLKAEMERRGVMCIDLANLLSVRPENISAKISLENCLNKYHRVKQRHNVK